MRTEILICDRCRRPAPRLIELEGSGDLCPNCLPAAISDLIRAGLSRLVPELAGDRRKVVAIGRRR